MFHVTTFQRIRKMICYVLPAILPAVPLAACSSGAGSVTKDSSYLVIGTTDGVDSLNPFVGLNQDSFNSWEEMYPALVQYNPRTLAFVPDFATSWKESANGLTWTFQLVKGARWSDGKPLTSADVAWTYNNDIKFENSATASSAVAVAQMTKAVAEGPSKVVFYYKRPVADALSNFQAQPILPEHVWAKYATGNGAALKTFTNTPSATQPVVSGGPFMVTKWVLNQVTVFKQNPYWYGPKPHIDGYVLQLFSNADAEVQALKSGQIDAIEEVPVTAVSDIRSAGFHVYVGPSLTWRDFTINGNPRKVGDRELLNPLVREAFEYAIDRQEIVKDAWLGYASPGSVMVSPGDGIWHDPNVSPLPFDLAKANQLLNQAGYKMGPNGVRIADGHPMSYPLDFSTDQNGPGDRVFAIIQSDFAKIGVQLNEVKLDPAAEMSAIEANDYRNFDLAMWFWIPLIDPSLILSAYTCSQYDGWNDNGYCNPTYDRLYNEQAVTLNQQKRLAIIYQMEKMVYESRSEIVLVYNKVIDAWSNKWTGFVESPQGFYTQFSRLSLESVHHV
jgi:peptide/nickel transport system substrate-binding protein